MKKIITIIIMAIIVGIFTNAQAEERFPCKDLSDAAETIMKCRQDGMKMSLIIEALPENEVKNIFISIVQDAYDVPRFETEKNKRKAVIDFTNSVYLECSKATSK